MNDESKQAKRSYLVCATHRSGSNLFCQALWLSALAGFPQECFSPTRSPIIADEHGLTAPDDSFAGYLSDLLVKRQTANGVFGAKMMWKHMDWFAEQLRNDPANAGVGANTVAAMLDHAFPNLNYLWVRRRDKVKQAISLCKAKQTKVYNSMQEDDGLKPDAVELVYDFKSIDKELKRFEKEEAAWQKYFSDHGISPFVIEYENFVKSYSETAIEALRFLDVDVPDGYEQPESHYRKQADTVNDEWYARYHSEASMR